MLGLDYSATMFLAKVARAVVAFARLAFASVALGDAFAMRMAETNLALSTVEAAFALGALVAVVLRVALELIKDFFVTPMRGFLVSCRDLNIAATT
jgi:hypothetical protein